MTLDHKTSHMGTFFCYDRTIFGRDTTIENLESEEQKNLNIEKISFKVVHLCSRLCCIHSQKYMFYIFTVGHLLNIFMEHDLNILMIFGIKEKCIILTRTVYSCYCHRYTRAAPDWVCGPGSHL